MKHADPVPHGLADAMDRVACRASPLGTPLVYYEETGSTNDVAAGLAASGSPHGTLVVARTQTQGRGRHTRQWFSPPDAGLYFSLVLRPPPDTRVSVPVLTLAAGVAVAEGIERQCGLSAQIKWPNDLVMPAPLALRPRSRWGKLAGVLAEATVVGTIIQHVVLGIGINVQDEAYPAELTGVATSLAREAGRDVEPFPVLAECVAALQGRWQQLFAGQLALVLDEWRRRSPSSKGASVRVVQGNVPVAGETCGLDVDGALCVAVGENVMKVVAGEVQWL